VGGDGRPDAEEATRTEGYEGEEDRGRTKRPARARVLAWPASRCRNLISEPISIEFNQIHLVNLYLVFLCSKSIKSIRLFEFSYVPNQTNPYAFYGVSR
jgi:hypothetical protein